MEEHLAVQCDNEIIVSVLILLMLSFSQYICFTTSATVFCYWFMIPILMPPLGNVTFELSKQSHLESFYSSSFGLFCFSYLDLIVHCLMNV